MLSSGTCAAKIHYASKYLVISVLIPGISDGRGSTQ